MRKSKMVNFLKSELNNDGNKIVYFKYEKDNEVFIGDQCCVFCLDRNLIPVKRNKCISLPIYLINEIANEVESSDLVEIVKKSIILIDNNKRIQVFELSNIPEGLLSCKFYLNKRFCDLFADNAVYYTKFNKEDPSRSFVYVFEKNKFVGFILQIKR